VKILVFIKRPKFDDVGPTQITEVEGDIAVERIAAIACKVTAIGLKNRVVAVWDPEKTDYVSGAGAGPVK
jgi:hypothetical protein